MNSIKARIIFVVVLCVVSFMFFWHSPPTSPVTVQHLDKVVHFILFFVLAASMHYAFRFPYWLSMVILTGYGISIEFIQHYIPGRGADVWDVVADVAGAAAFFVLFHLYKVNRNKRQRA